MDCIHVDCIDSRYQSVTTATPEEPGHPLGVANWPEYRTPLNPQPEGSDRGSHRHQSGEDKSQQAPHSGLKIFYKQDDPVMTDEEVQRLSPDVIIYQ